MKSEKPKKPRYVVVKRDKCYPPKRPIIIAVPASCTKSDDEIVADTRKWINEGACINGRQI